MLSWIKNTKTMSLTDKNICKERVVTNMAKGLIFDIKEFTVHDGPGIRTTVFFKGCPLRCAWCHNPEGLSFQPELMINEASCTHCNACKKKCGHVACEGYKRCLKACPNGLIKLVGETVCSEELANTLKKQEQFLKMNDGGITLSGGEPLAQPEFLLALLKELKPMHLVVETSGHGSKDVFKEVVETADLILYDIKIADPELHLKMTGKDNILILENLQQLIDSGKKFIARIPLVPGVNDDRKNLEKTSYLLQKATNLIRVELLPYNPFTEAKYKMMGEKYNPSFDAMVKPDLFLDIFEKHQLTVSVL